MLVNPAGLWFGVTTALANANWAGPWRGGDFPTPERNGSHSYALVTVSVGVWSRMEGGESGSRKKTSSTDKQTNV